MLNLTKDKSVREVVSRLGSAGKGGVVRADGTWGSFAPMLAAHISGQLGQCVVYVSAHLDDADNVGDDLAVFAPQGKGVEVFPVWEGASDLADATDEVASHRLKMVLGLSKAKRGEGHVNDLIISTCAQALNQPVPKPEFLEQDSLRLETGQTIEPELVVGWLADNGFERVDAVDMPGQFAQRGGIVDVFASVTGESASVLGDAKLREGQPIRFEFFGDEVESIRVIDLDTQRSTEGIAGVQIVAPTGHERLEETDNLINMLPEDAIIILDEPAEVAEVSRTFLERVERPEGLYSWEAIYEAMGRFTRLEVNRFGGGEGCVHMGVSSAQRFESKGGQIWKGKEGVLDELVKEAEENRVLMFCENTAEVKRVREILGEKCGDVPESMEFPIGFVRQGFVLAALNTIVVTHHELFGQYAVRRRVRTVRSSTPVESLIDLNKGDFVVHINYGIGKFKGIKTIEKRGSETEYLVLEYADEMIINVPVSNISLVQKYIGAMPRRPKLSKVGTKKWENQKKKVAEGVQELAAELLETQAKREESKGYSFGADTIWQKEFEEAFPYQETTDQLTSVEQIKGDMKEARPMDRLLCGDVGYGKTELAMRAAFKAVEGGKQVAVLVPTTVLCVQHGETFAERFAEFPVTIEVLNRFVSGAQAREVVSRAKQGKVDVLIGTHRLLSKDVGFKDLGLLIVDEEQRFGVEHKERLKQFRVDMDVLTMTATPIPRTLHMSLLGLKDISSLSTPPLDRRSVVTKVCRYDRETIRRAIMHEINREGQVYFVHNRVQTIKRVAEEVRKILNSDRITIEVAHGQMPKSKLERAMLNFVHGKTDILVCSTIIESGLDIPNANTMIINDADRFGLAQLHQLRGRVGRYKHRAYAYMLLPASRPVTPIAAKRLKAIEEYSSLGAGFRIALRDLEIRGAGNILGPEQSGHINTVGYEMYCRMLGDAVKKLKDEPVEKGPSALVDLGFSTYIPKSYVPSDRQRMDVYRRLSATKTSEDVERLREELADIYGPVPGQVELLLDMSDIRIRASQWGVQSLVARGEDLVFMFDDPAVAGDLFARSPGKVRIIDPKQVNVRLEKRYFEPRTLMAVLRKLLRKRG
ncbi:Transcription-repair-coupling factor [Anaerohalosphaera lusitana]|uniref:Transcription-repair-coupling factor n=1 Tax=Anaerohalosphaera lusitana TaxID=1936003 RepID=A0A1U9NJQ5_9BACT|nr:transcription-repair coupling factor [Anaerohalosphaera lusitana]AQT68149.1 Transcription-repair-coupling factor [Anaerohalosphaera lusitana]